MIEIRSLNKSKLAAFIQSPEFNKLNFVPITKHRALSHIVNPRAEAEDILLLLAYDENVLVGYLGVLADHIYTKGNAFEKCGWLSCMWIDDAYRGKKIAQKLIETCFLSWSKGILVTEFTDAAEGLYNKTQQFNSLQIKKGLRIYVRSDMQTLLPPHKKLFAQLKPVLKLKDVIINSVCDLRFMFYNTSLQSAGLEYVNSLDNEVADFIAGQQQTQLFKRGVDELNWIINNPWILSAPEKDAIGEKYHFSSTDKSFDFYTIKVRDINQKLIALLIFSKRNYTLKLPYCYFTCNADIIIDVIKYHILKWKIKTFTVFHESLVNAMKKKSIPALYKKEVMRKYIISKTFDISSYNGNFEIQDGDADCSFT